MKYRISLIVLLILTVIFSRDSIYLSTGATSGWPELFRQGGSRGKYIALTFDDAPSPDTEILLRILDDYDVRATFFVEGIFVSWWPDKLLAIADAGHEIGNHSWNHPNFTRINDAQIMNELEQTNQIIIENTGIIPHLFRPPGGNRNDHTDELVFSYEMTTVMWTVSPLDYEHPSESVLIARVMGDVSPGGIILLHDGVDVTRDALPEIITLLRDAGYTFVTVGELIEMGYGECPWDTHDVDWEPEPENRGTF